MSILNKLQGFLRGGIKAELSGDRSPWSNFWFTAIGSRTATGSTVSADSAMQLSAVYACVRLLSETMAMLPFVLYRRKADGSKEVIKDHWLYRLFCIRPNEWQNPFEWREMLQGHLCLRGNAYCEIVEGPSGAIESLIPIHPDRINIHLFSDGTYVYRVHQLDGSWANFPRNKIWHIRGLSSDGIMGISPISVSREIFGAALASQEYSARFWTNDAKPTGGWIEFDGTFKDQEAKRLFEEKLQSSYSGTRQGRIMVLDNGLKYHQVSISNKDSQYLESRNFDVTQIARIFRVPPHKIQDLSKSAFSNIEQQSMDFVNDTMAPWATRWEWAIKSDLLNEVDIENGLEIDFDFYKLLRGDTATRSAYIQNGILTGWMNRNEARISEGLNPAPGLDEFLQPLNMGTSDMVKKMLEAKAPGSSPTGKQTVQPEDDTDENTASSTFIPTFVKGTFNDLPDSLDPSNFSESVYGPVPPAQAVSPISEAQVSAVVSGVISRIVRKEAAVIEKAQQTSPALSLETLELIYSHKHAHYIAESLAIPETSAISYCERMPAEIAVADIKYHTEIAEQCLMNLLTGNLNAK